jgi:hypothetical protein
MQRISTSSMLQVLVVASACAHSNPWHYLFFTSLSTLNEDSLHQLIQIIFGMK